MPPPASIAELQERNARMWERLREGTERNTDSAFRCVTLAIQRSGRRVPEELKPMVLAFEILIGALVTEAIASAADRPALARRLLPLLGDARKVLLGILRDNGKQPIDSADASEPGAEKEELEDLEHRLELLEARAVKLLEAAAATDGTVRIARAKL